MVDEPALIEALKAGIIGGAGLDTFSPELPAPDNPLWALDNVVLSPHIGGGTEEARREVSPITYGNVIALLKGETLLSRFFVLVSPAPGHLLTGPPRGGTVPQRRRRMSQE